MFLEVAYLNDKVQDSWQFSKLECVISFCHQETLKHVPCIELAELVPLIAPVTNLAASYWTLSRRAESQSEQLFQITSIYSISVLIRLLYKDVKMERPTLYVINFGMFNRLEAFSYTLTIWFLHGIVLCKVKPRWVWDSVFLTALEMGNREGWTCWLRFREIDQFRYIKIQS